MKPTISTAALLLLRNNIDLVLVDARSGPGAKEKYLAEHLQSTVWVDLETDLAQKTCDPADGGRHPLPMPQHFNLLLAQLGISQQSHVVVYDDKNGANAAARFWWMAKAIGQSRVQVLDGGMVAALAAGYPTSKGEEQRPAVERPTAERWLLPTAFIDDVEKAAKDPNYLVIDVREKDRYDGLREPLDLVAGHIPGAINIPYFGNLGEDGCFLSPEVLHEKYKAALAGHDAEHTIVHCGSGVTACHTLLAIAEAGLDLPRLYVGSWSEWSRSGREFLPAKN
jgi:thiosulfate/3-mercaptopyruvate sulfurtransferase